MAISAPNSTQNVVKLNSDRAKNSLLERLPIDWTPKVCLVKVIQGLTTYLDT